jgi:L-asparaginase
MTFSEAINTVTRTPRVIRRPNMTDLLNLVDPGLAVQLAPVDRQGRPNTAPAPAPPAPSVQPSAQLAKDGQVLFITTGGTIDKDYPRVTGGYAFEIGNPAVAEILEALQTINAVGFSFSIVSVCRKDSQDLSHQDRTAILDQCIKSKAEKIVITHGTDTMVETGEFLLGDAVLQQQNKTVVLTGAVRPSKFAFSDACFNLGTALGALGCSNTNKPESKLRVFIAMSGQVLDVAKGVQRDGSTGVFSQV